MRAHIMKQSPWLITFGYLCIQEVLVVIKSSVFPLLPQPPFMLQDVM